ncbi:MAG: primosomal protein N' [Nitrospirota bacterium]
MEFVDVVFPLNLGPLTYRCPDSFAETIRPGMIVSAPLVNRTVRGIVKGGARAGADVKEIIEIHGERPVLSTAMLGLLEWMSGYYLAAEGLVLKTMLPKEVFTGIKKRKVEPSHAEMAAGTDISFTACDDSIFEDLIGSTGRKIFRTFLFRAPSTTYEYSLLVRVLEQTRNALVLVPELSVIRFLYRYLYARFGERVCLFHGDLSKGERLMAIDRFLSGRSDIVLGTRSAVFAPLKEVSLIAVLHEHNSSYKQEKTPYYNGRDVAVMRGYIEKAPVLLSSICPSIESIYNCKKGKYVLIESPAAWKKARPKIIDMRYEKTVRPYLSRKIVDAAAKYLRAGKKTMFVLNRRGYSTLLQCDECLHIAECPTCKIPLIFHKRDRAMKCHYCGHRVFPVPERCGGCGGHNVRLLGAGTEKIQEDIEELTGAKTVRVDRDSAAKESELGALLGDALTDDSRIIIGTKLLTKRWTASGYFSMAGMLNPDLHLNIPDFRSAERAYQEIILASDRVEPDGEILIQTRMPQHHVYSSLRNYDFNSFVREELSTRKTLNYPPYSRLILIECISRSNASREFEETARNVSGDIELLGPHLTRDRRGRSVSRLLLKSSNRTALHAAALVFLNSFKNSKGLKIRIDVDPLTI